MKAQQLSIICLILCVLVLFSPILLCVLPCTGIISGWLFAGLMVYWLGGTCGFGAMAIWLAETA